MSSHTKASNGNIGVILRQLDIDIFPYLFYSHSSYYFNTCYYFSVFLLKNCVVLYISYNNLISHDVISGGRLLVSNPQYNIPEL